jgi:hypothetical protein
VSGFQGVARVTIPPRVARWYSFKPKIPTWVNFGGL